ncbi:hypothetical protein EWI07_02295 [Sporolactobacillus sp. THM7-4]|nr:hypothetical protein EWI07_02295 [Sporolactobacillus sp. THM7-4]
MSSQAGKPVKKAVALKYTKGADEAPHITAKGEGRLAEKLIKEAKKNNIPIQEDESLVSMLSELDINEIIPEELYAAVAEIYTFIYNIDKRAGRS